MTRYAILTMMVLSMTGCMFHYRNPAPKQQTETIDPTCGGSGTVEPYVRVGIGKWTDSAGRVHQQPVYIRVDELDKGVKGPEGVRGAKGHPGATSRPVPLSSLTNRFATYVEVVPDPPSHPEIVRQDTPQPPAKFKTETDGGGPGLTTFVPPWFTAKEYLPPIPSPAVVQPKSPGYKRGQTSIGEGGGGSSTGGGIMESAAEKAAKSPYIIMGLGGLLILGAVVIWFITKNVRMTLIVAVTGAVIFGIGVALDIYPWLILVAVGIVALAVVGFGLWWAYNNRAALQNKLALQSVADGIENADMVVTYTNSVGATVTATVSELAKKAIKAKLPSDKGASVKATVAAAKAAAKV